MKKILILTNVGIGLYKFRKELIKQLIKENNVVVFSCNEDEYVPKLLKLGCEYIPTEFGRRSKNLLNDIKLMFSYRAILKTVKPDVVLTYTIKPNIYGGLMCNNIDIPYITTITGLGTELQRDTLFRKAILLVYKAALNKPACVFFQNEANLHFFTNKGIVNKSSRTELLPGSGVNLAQFRFAEYVESDSRIEFIYVARIMKDKGICELLEAAKEIKATYPNVYFNLFGGYDEDYALLVNAYEEKDIIRYHGEKESIQDYLAKSHAIIHPSHHEGLSNVLLEAAATGRPILASNIEGCKETFDEGVSGFGFEVKNASCLKDTIAKFINLPYEQKMKMGRASREKVEKEFDRSIVIGKYMDAIREAVEA